MSQSLLYHAFGVREGYDYVETQYRDRCIRFVLAVRSDGIQCPVCGGKEVARKGRRFRELQTVPIGLKPVFLVTEVPQCQCAACGKRFEVAPFAPAYARYTHRLQAFIEDLRGMMTVSDLAAVTGLGWDTVKHIIKAKLEKDYGHPRGFLGVICGMDVGNTGHIKLGCPSPKRHSQAPFQFPAW